MRSVRFRRLEYEKTDFDRWYERALQKMFSALGIPYDLLQEKVEMRYIESPDELNENDAVSESSIFLAGGITGCPNWQQQMVGLFEGTPLTIVNPRRADFPIGDPIAAQEQIHWEHRHLRRVNAIMFWFCAETVCPIVLYELGAWSMTKKPIFVGVDPEYIRKQNVEIQTSLSRPEVTVVYSLEALALQVKDYFENEERMESGELHTVYYDEKVQERELSIQVRIDDQLEWFPKSEISHVRQENDLFAFDIPLWLAVKKGLI